MDIFIYGHPTLFGTLEQSTVLTQPFPVPSTPLQWSYFLKI